MSRLLRIELFRLRHSKGFKVLMGLSAVLGVFGIVAATVVDGGAHIGGYEAFYKQFGDLKSLMFVLIGIFSGLFIGEDFATRTLHAQVTSGYSRVAILLSKSMVYLLGISLFITTEVLVTTLGTTVLYGFGPQISGTLILGMARAFFMFVFLMSGIAMICVTTAFLIKNKATIVAINVLLLVIVEGILKFAAMNISIFATLYEKTPFMQVVVTSSRTLFEGQLSQGLLAGVTCMLSCLMISYRLFQRSELM